MREARREKSLSEEGSAQGGRDGLGAGLGASVPGRLSSQSSGPQGRSERC